MNNLIKTSVMLLATLVISIACKRDIEEVVDDAINNKSTNDAQSYNADWTELSHGTSNCDYSIVFPQDSVNKIEISMTSEQWSSIRTNMKELFGFDFGASQASGGNFPDEETDYIDVLLTFNGKAWKNVGFRLKGNSSLSQAWGDGNYKLPFKLNFDEFEDDYPAIENQHFYGFKKLSFSPSYKDNSLMREKITPEIFRMAGIPAAQTAFYRVYINFGSGSQYCGVYTAVELPDDNMMEAEFGEEDGNIYKPESDFASFTQSEFDKKNNETLSDYSDVQDFISVLNNNIRTSEPERWRSELESTFNMDHFIKYLAVNNAIVNWDSYGVMPHNYYLYNHSTNNLTWIPWDHNEALSGSPGITGTSSTRFGVPGNVPPGNEGPGDGNGMGHTPLSLSMNEVTSSWPLIYYVANDETYMAKYKEYLKWFNNEVFTQEALDALIDKYYAMITPFAIGSNGEQQGYTYLDNEQSFINAYNDLKTHISDRKALISSYLP